MQQGPYHGQNPYAQRGPYGQPGAQQGPYYGQQPGVYGYGPPGQQMGPMYGQQPPSGVPGPMYGEPNQAGQLDAPEKMMGMHQPPEIRNGFIRKVYGILTVQLVVTALIATYMNTQISPQWAAKHSSYFQAISFSVLVFTLVVTCCCNHLMRQYPTNYIILSIITVGISIMTSYVTLFYSTQAVLQAVLVTGLVFGGLTFYACTTKSDFTGMGPYLSGALMCLIIFPMVLWMFSMFGLDTSNVAGISMQQIMAFFGVLVFTFYIIYDTQLIVGGTHAKHQFSIDDYCFAALNLYLDIINLFLYLLQLLSAEQRQ
jgi:FtsH-binding integral membrane protein